MASHDYFEPIVRREYYAKLILSYIANISRLMVDFYFARALLGCITFKMHFCTFKSTALSGRKRHRKRILGNFIAAALLFRCNLFFVEISPERHVVRRADLCGDRASGLILHRITHSASERELCSESSADGVSRNFAKPI